MTVTSAPRLLAVVEVEKEERVFCAQPGCNHTVYKAIHVVRDSGQLLVLGSTCFAKRYGGMTALGGAEYWGGKGKLLTAEERALLQGNTDALLAKFEAERAHNKEEAARKLQAQSSLKDQLRISLPVASVRSTASITRSPFPWRWMRPHSSVAAFKLRDGSGWVRVQHRDGRQFVVPWPKFDAWEESLPPVVGTPDLEVGGYLSANVAGAIVYLRKHRASERVTGIWKEVTDLLGDRP